MDSVARFKQRFQNFEKSFALLSRINALEKLSKAEELGLIRAFEIC